MDLPMKTDTGLLKTGVIKKRELYFDVLWVFAMLFQIFAYSEGKDAYELCAFGSMSYRFCLFMTVFSRFSLWLCLMISGAVLLEKEESIKKVWGGRISRVVIILLVSSFGYYMLDVIKGREEFDLARFLIDIYSRERLIQFWYLYAYIGFLVCLPFLRPLVKNMRNADFIYLIAAVFVLSSILPLIDAKVLLGRYCLNPSMKLDWLSAELFIYPVLGYYFHNRVKLRECRVLAPVLAILDIIWMLYNTFVMETTGTSAGSVEMYPSYHGRCVMLHCITLFVCAKALFHGREKNNLHRTIGSLGGCSLGIYLLGPLFLDGRVDLFENLRLTLRGDAEGVVVLWAAFVWSVIVYCICFVPTWLVRRIPGLKKVTT